MSTESGRTNSVTKTNLNSKVLLIILTSAHFNSELATRPFVYFEESDSSFENHTNGIGLTNLDKFAL